MITFPNAKINLGLNIVSKREDGYHNIESCFYPIPWHDCLEIIEAASFSFASYGLTIPGEEKSNLCIKAYNLLKKDFDLPPVQIHLLKNIPMGAGLGGGSADGAFTLVMLNDLFHLDISNQGLAKYALQLGSDCPFFVENKPAIASGRGEILEELSLDLTQYHLALHNPGIHVSTKQAYAGVTPADPERSISEIVNTPVSDWTGSLTNDFESSVFPMHADIEKLKGEMYQAGAVYASMTGSGSTIYGLFEKEPRLDSQWRVFSL